MDFNGFVSFQVGITGVNLEVLVPFSAAVREAVEYTVLSVVRLHISLIPLVRSIMRF